MRIIVWDIEIARPVDDFPEKWEAARAGKCGIASIALWDSFTGRPHIYGPTAEWNEKKRIFVPGDYRNVYEAIDHLNTADLLVGFNSVGFDTPATCGTLDVSIEPRHYDILGAVWTALDGQYFKGWRLEDIASRTLDKHKTFNGAGAPRLFQSGRFAELHDYNINDVMLTLELFDFIRDEGYVVGPGGTKLQLPPPPRRKGEK